MNTLTFLLCFLSTIIGTKPTHNDSGVLKLDLSKYERVNIYNMGGNIKVRTTSSNQSTIKYKRTLTATTNRKLDRAKQEITVDTVSMDGELFIYIANPEKVLRSTGGDYLSYQNAEGTNPFNGIKASGIKYEFDFDIVMPSDVDGVVSTHVGDIDIRGIKGELAVLNHHGHIHLDEVHQLEYVKSHHGELKVAFSDQPNHDLSLKTHHGNISVSFPSTPSLRLDLDSYHGSFFTDFNWEPLVKKIKMTDEKKTKYKVGSKTSAQIGDGEYLMSFQSHHGNMYILKH